MATTTEAQNLIAEAHEVVDRSERLQLAAAQLAIALYNTGQGVAVDTIEERLNTRPATNVNAEAYLIGHEAEMLPHAKTIIGLLHAEASRRAGRAATAAVRAAGRRAS